MITILILLILLALAAIFFLILFLRARRFTPIPLPEHEAVPAAVDWDQAVEHLRAMIRCRTVSQPAERDEAEFEKFRGLLREFYPRLVAAGGFTRIDCTGVLLRLPGECKENPAVFLSHYDVVPAEESAWEHPPFAADLEDGVLWGRGTLDMKNQLCSMLEAAELLLSEGFTPKRDIFFALSGEEEMMGPSAASIRDHFREQGITPSFVLDEGGDIMDAFFPGVEAPCAMVGVGEKGCANLEFILEGPGGHASVPIKKNPLIELSRAMPRVSDLKWQQRIGSALDSQVDTMGRYAPFPTKLLLANRHLLKPLYLRWLRRQGGMLEAGSRTTVAVTQASGSAAGNAIPARATMFANARLLWGDTEDSLAARCRKALRNDEIVIERHISAAPRPDSELGPMFERLQGAIHATWPEAVISPYLMVACTDSRHWRDICPHVYRFSAKQVTGAEKATVHGNNERIRVINTRDAITFFYRLMKEC